jgi:hypothetical protein
LGATARLILSVPPNDPDFVDIFASAGKGKRQPKYQQGTAWQDSTLKQSDPAEIPYCVHATLPEIFSWRSLLSGHIDKQIFQRPGTDTQLIQIDSIFDKLLQGMVQTTGANLKKVSGMYGMNSQRI